jgi:hypothetical protein
MPKFVPELQPPMRTSFLHRALLIATLLTSTSALRAQCVGAIDGLSPLPGTNWTVISVPGSLSLDRTVATVAGSTTIVVTGCSGTLVDVNAPITGPGIPSGAFITGGTCPDLTISAPATITGSGTATFILPAYTEGAPPGNAGTPAGVSCSLSPASFQAFVCAGEFVTYYMCPNNAYTFSMCSSISWNSSITVTNAAGTTVANGAVTFDDDGCGEADGHATLTFIPAVAGTYRIRVLSGDCTVDPGICGRLDVISNPVVVPVNDEPTGATPLSVGTECTWTDASLANATTTNGTTPSTPTNCGPAPCSPGSGLFAGRDVWFSATVPISGRIAFRTEMLNGSDMAMAAYDGPTFCNSCNDDQAEGVSAPYLEFPVLQPGTTVYVRVWPRSGNPLFTDFRICATEPAPPVNDTPCAATDLPVNTSCEALDLNTFYATAATGNVSLSPGTPSCAANGTQDVWVRVVMPDAPALFIETSYGSHTALALSAYTLTSGDICGTGTLLEQACAVSAVGGAAPALTLTGTAGTIYWVRIWGTELLNGTFSICARQATPPVNDDPCGALPLDLAFGCLPEVYSSLYATRTPASGAAGTTSIPDPGEPCATNDPQNDLWFTAVVPPNGELRLDTEESTLTDAAMAVYTATGACAEGTLSLTQWPGAGGCATTGSEQGADMPALQASGLEPGSTVYLRVWRESGPEGDVRLCAGRTDVPPGTCRYELELSDAGNDGWDGAALSVCIYLQGAGTPVCTAYTITGGAGEVLIAADPGDVIELTFAANGTSADQVGVRLVVLSTGTAIVDMTAPPSQQLISFAVTTDCAPPAPTQTDCPGAVELCEEGPVDVFASGMGTITELDASNQGCLADGEAQGHWFYMTTYAEGSLAFTMTPADPDTDLNWAIWGPEALEDLCDLDTPPLRCSFSNGSGPTGMREIAEDASEGLDGDGWVKPILSVPLRSYLLYVDSREAGGFSFDLTFQNDPPNLVNCEGLPTAVNDADQRQGSLQVRPNPAQDQITLSGMVFASPAFWTIRDASGRTVRMGRFTNVMGEEAILSITDLDPGAYALDLLGPGGRQQVARFVKQ